MIPRDFFGWAAVAFLGVAVAWPMPQATISRTYWRVPLDTLAIGHPKHTHAAVTGVVSYYRREDDGDLHIKLTSPSGRFIIAECVPELPCATPRAGTTITVRGITRQDPEHLWWEIHPVESWSTAP